MVSGRLAKLSKKLFRLAHGAAPHYRSAAVFMAWRRVAGADFYRSR